LGFGVLELSQSQDVEEHTVPYDVKQEHLQLVTTNSGSTQLSDVDANTDGKGVQLIISLFSPSRTRFFSLFPSKVFFLLLLFLFV